MKKLMLINTMVLSLVTTGLSIYSLQLAQPLFKSAWLRPALFPDFGAKIGFALLVFIFSLSLIGIWMWLWTKLLGLLKVHPLKSLSFATVSWLGLVLLDTVVRVRIAEVWGHRFTLETATAAVETPWQLMLSLWRWYRDDILLCAVGLAGFIGLGVFINAQTRRRLSRYAHDTVHSRAFLAMMLGATVVALLMVSLFVGRWPATMTQVTNTSVGYPYAALASVATDFDGDGWGYFDVPPDTKPFDARCKPYAVDVPDDGIDENLLAGDLQFDAFAQNADENGIAQVDWPEVTFSRTPNVMVIFMESVRFDSINKTIDGQAVMPSFQRLIQNGALAPRHAFASQGYTFSSVKQFVYGDFQSSGSTVFDDFSFNGYETAIFSGYDLKEEKFDAHMHSDVVFDPTMDKTRAGRYHSTPARLLVKRIDKYLAQRQQQQNAKPFFLWSFFVDPHFPYKQVNTPVFCKKYVATKDIRPGNKNAVMRSYYDQVYHVDAAARQLMKSLKKHGLAKSTIVIFVSDHGESLFDDGNTIGHGIAINDVMTHLAMVVVNSPIDVPDVLSHHHLRGLLRQMMNDSRKRSPILAPMPERKLFQYIGNLRYPREIGTYSVSEGRIVYNLKSNQIENLTLHTATEFAGVDNKSKLNQQGLSIIKEWEYQLYLSRKVAKDRESKLADKQNSHHPAQQI